MTACWTNLAVYTPLPVLLAVMVGLAPQTRLYRSFFLDELGQDYVRTARAKGMGEGTVLFKHVLRNAMIPILTNIGLQLPSIFVGSFLIEVFFSIPGLGREVLLAVNRSDFPVIQAVTIYLAVLTMFINLLTDLAYKIADPRVVLEVRGDADELRCEFRSPGKRRFHGRQPAEERRRLDAPRGAASRATAWAWPR